MSLCDLSEVIHQLDLKVQCGEISPIYHLFEVSGRFSQSQKKHLKTSMTISSNKFPSFFPCLCQIPF